MYVIDPEIKCPCGNYAVSFVEMHNIDKCTPEEPNTTGFMCNACIVKMIAMLEELLSSVFAFCASCHKPFVTLSDIIVRQSPLGEGK